jgi:CO/xanthine dehydrogenase Mo-binding subunit
VYAQIAAEQLGVDMDDVFVTTGDTNEFDWGAGTFASRGMALVGTAVYNASSAIREKALDLASQVLETPKDELELADGMVRVADIPHQSISLGELANLANPTRGTVEPGVEPGLEATSYFAPPHGATGQGSMVMFVEADPETFLVEIKRVTLVHDCGTVINPLLLEGQILGGLSMGIGNSFFEHLIYDKNGQVLNASLMDYLLPTSLDMPSVIDLGHIESPSPLNPLGIKGVGEAGAIPTPCCFVQAVENALSPLVDLEILETPLKPSRLFELVKAAKGS